MVHVIDANHNNKQELTPYLHHYIRVIGRGKQNEKTDKTDAKRWKELVICGKEGISENGEDKIEEEKEDTHLDDRGQRQEDLTHETTNASRVTTILKNEEKGEGKTWINKW